MERKNVRLGLPRRLKSFNLILLKQKKSPKEKVRGKKSQKKVPGKKSQEKSPDNVVTSQGHSQTDDCISLIKAGVLEDLGATG